MVLKVWDAAARIQLIVHYPECFLLLERRIDTESGWCLLFVSVITKRLIKTWILRSYPRVNPFALLKTPLGECRRALLRTGVIALKTKLRFNKEGDRRNPWVGDRCYRINMYSQYRSHCPSFWAYYGLSRSLRWKDCSFSDSLEYAGKYWNPRHDWLNSA